MIGEAKIKINIVNNNIKLPVLLCTCLLFVIGGLILFPISAKANSNIVRIGYYDASGYLTEDEKGVKSGYAYEYLQELSKFAGWDYIYKNGTLEECLEWLEAGTIDILSPLPYTEEYEEKFDFSNLPLGNRYFTLVVEEQEDHYIPYDFDNYNGIKIGILQGSQSRAYLEEYAAENGFTYEAVYYKEVSESEEALAKGEVNAILMSSVRTFEGKKVIAKFKPEPFYFIVKKGRTELLNNLNEAMNNLNMRNSAFEATLHKKYFNMATGDSVYFNVKEKAYLRQKKEIKVVVMPDAAPLSYFENGVYKGIVADIMAKIEEDIGTPFTYIKTDTYSESIKMVQDGNADIIAIFVNDYNWADSKDIRFTAPYMEYLYSAISLKGNQKSQIVAAASDYHFSEQYIEKNYQKENITYFPTEKTCVDAVLAEKADIAYVSTYLAEMVMQKDYNRLNSVLVKDYKSNLSIGISKQCDPLLYAILDQEINALKDESVSDILAQYSTTNYHEITLQEYIYQNPIHVIGIIVAAFIIIIAVFLSVIRMKKKHSTHIFNLAYVDKLTKEWNLNYLEQEGKKIIGGKKEKRSALLSVDIHRFTLINESYGRALGDEVIIRMAEVFRQVTVKEKLLARAKADHFLMLLVYEDQEELKNILQEMRDNLSYYEGTGVHIKLILNIGICLIEKSELSIRTAINYAEIARKEAKYAVSRTAYFNKNMENRLIREKELEDSTEQALLNREFVVFYQPKFDTLTNEIVGAEALVRWNRGEECLLLPDEFIPIFENNGFIIELDFYVLEEVCRLLRSCLDSGKDIIPISVNQSRLHFSEVDYVERLDTMLDNYQIPKSYIELEITETAFVEADATKARLKSLKELGFKLSIDDFGSEYSSPIILREESIDTLKIDKTFLEGTQGSARSQIIVHKIVKMAQNLNLDVICEGVEHPEQTIFLKEIGCHLVQGFLYSKPLNETHFMQKLEDCKNK